jgi:hypothetical protein
LLPRLHERAVRRHAAGEQPEAWLICDHAAQRRYGIGWAKPFPFLPASISAVAICTAALPWRNWRSAVGSTPRSCSARWRLQPYAAQGRDPAFQRGVSAYNQAQGEPLQVPNPSLRPLLKGPFHAVKLLPGSLGTFAGLAQTPRPACWTTRGSRYPGCLQWVTTCTA